MRWNIGNKITVSFAVSIVIFAAVATISYQGLRKNTEHIKWVEHTHEVLDTFDTTLVALTDSETGQRGFVITGIDSYLEPYLRAKEVMNKTLDMAKELTADNSAQQKRIDALRLLVAAKVAELQETIDLRHTKGFEAAVEVIRSDKGKRVMDEIRTVVSEMKSEEQSLLKKRQLESESSGTYLKLVIVLGTLLSALFLLSAGFWLTRSIARPIGAVTGVAERIAAGDLTVKVDAEERSDEIGVLQRALRTMVENLRDFNKEMQSGFGVIASSSTEILATVSQVATGASETVTAVSETMTTTEEVKQTAHLSSQKAIAVQANAQKTAAISEIGRQAVADTSDGLNRIREQMELIAESVVRLSEQGQTIGEIIAAVNDLAEQSNLLAVNAAIEATRAGEYGKGFAVVAQEVKSLAEQSRQATTQVRTILTEVQKATSAAVMATELGTKAVADGVKQSNEAGNAILELTKSVGEAEQAATQIAASSQQQLVGMDQIASAIVNIKQATTQSMAGSEQLKASVQGLQAMGGRMKVLVERQRVAA